MERFLRLKHWQITILLLLGILTSNIEITNAHTLSLIIKLLGIFIYMSYPLIIGISLQNYLPRNIELNINLFQINSFICIVFYAAVMIIADGKEMTFSGLAAVPFFYVFYAFIHFLGFPAKTLKTIELKKKASLGEYIGDFFLIVFLPLGIWFLQPRINKIIEGKNTNETTFNN